MEDCENDEPTFGRDDSFNGREFLRKFDGPKRMNHNIRF